ncbi:hypothetical protein LTR56_018774 [Elasticomyces elasticus]|nr:hypothetical protein LTR56_018774 [Elasticomyces elasticus]KAK3635769.1 hypothetical protein LTR22_019049 [Elasticomyces elasticus]KAK4911928.1 hypothetical protein LTR49_019575 [Elasticomyces elasticus]KAK5743049.1 hypothetical protein LTS12_024005 [Elasticomyces elasticus]
MKAFLLPTLVLTTFAFAGVYSHKCACLTDAETSYLVNGFRVVSTESTGYEALANKILAVNFTSISDGINFVDGVPLNTTITTSRAQILAQEAGLPPAGEVTDIFISHSCDTITWYYEFPTTPLPIRVIAILFVNADKQIYKAYRELNSAAVLWNIGKPECQSNFLVTVGNAGPEPVNSTCKSCLQG